MDNSALKLVNLKLNYIKIEIQNLISLVEYIDYETPDEAEVSEENINMFSYRLNKLRKIFDKVYDDINAEQIEDFEAKRINSQILSNIRKYWAEGTNEENQIS